jgi:ubiquinone/menaquinone biosynthesis C-methylase UbiE
MSAEVRVPPGANRPVLRRFLRLFFRHFYHGFAWTYDFVAATVSIGRWNDWVECAIPYVEGNRILEIGHGPGHLQYLLRQRCLGIVIGLDESPQMLRMAAHRLEDAGYSNLNLSRGLAQSLPFRTHYFDTVVSTFPAEYIFGQETLQEVRRVLADGGRFIMLPAAWIIGAKAVDRVAAWLFRATDQAPRIPADILAERLRGPLEDAGFMPDFETVRVKSSEVLVVIAKIGPAKHDTGDSK